MSRLAVRAEIIKLGQVLGREPQALGFLQAIPAEDLHGLRLALDECLFRQHLRPLRRSVAILRWLPPRWSALLIRRVLGPRLGARLAAELPARISVRTARYMPESFAADCTAYVDPRRLHDVIALMPQETSLKALRTLLKRGDYISLGRIVEYLPDANIRAMEPLIGDVGALVEIAFFMESKNRLEHFVQLLPRERLRQAILLLQDESRRALWPKVMVLLMHVNPALQRELIELIAAQGDAAMNALVLVLHEEALFADVLPMVTAASPQTQEWMANLDVLKMPGVLESVLQTADDENQWGAQLAVLRWMREELRARVAVLLDGMPRATLERLVYAAVLGELWETVLDLVGRMSAARQREFAEILRSYGAVDAQLLQRVARQAQRYGLGDLLDPGQPAQPPA